MILKFKPDNKWCDEADENLHSSSFKIPWMRMQIEAFVLSVGM